MNDTHKTLAYGAVAGGILGYALWSRIQGQAEEDGESSPLDIWVPVGLGAAFGAFAMHVLNTPRAAATSVPGVKSNPGKCGDFGQASPQAISLLQNIDQSRLYRPMRNDVVQVGEVYQDPKTVGEF